MQTRIRAEEGPSGVHRSGAGGLAPPRCVRARLRRRSRLEVARVPEQSLETRRHDAFENVASERGAKCGSRQAEREERGIVAGVARGVVTQASPLVRESFADELRN